MKGRQDSHIFTLAAIAITAMQLWLIFSHAAWRDETQAVMVACATPNLRALFTTLHFEGHPSLWYLGLRGLCTVAPPTLALKIAQAGIALGVAALIVKRAPFGEPMRLVVLLGYFLLFEYGVIARSYSLGALIFLAFIAARRQAWRGLLLFCLANISVHFLLLAGACWALVVSEERRIDLKTSLAFGLGAFVSALSFWPVSAAHPALSQGPNLAQNLGEALMWMSTVAAPVRFDIAGWGQHLPDGLAITVGTVILPLGALAFRGSLRWMTLWLSLGSAILLLSVFVYVSYPRHVGVLALWLIGLNWARLEDEGVAPDLVSKAWLSLLAASGVWMAMLAMAQPFSASEAIARWLKARPALAQSPICVYPGWHAPDLTARLGKPVCDLKTGRMMWFEPWDRPPQPLEDQAATAKLLGRARLVLDRPFLIYADGDNQTLEQSGARRLATFPANLQGGPMAIFLSPPIQQGVGVISAKGQFERAQHRPHS